MNPDGEELLIKKEALPMMMNNISE